MTTSGMLPSGYSMLSRSALIAASVLMLDRVRPEKVFKSVDWPLLVISSPDLQTVQLGLALFVVKNRTVWDQVMAGSVLATLPVLLIFLIFQKYFIRGISLTGMK